MYDYLCVIVIMLLCAVFQVNARRSRQVVTEVERDYAMSGKFDQLVEEQRRIDAERDAEVLNILYHVGNLTVLHCEPASLHCS